MMGRIILTADDYGFSPGVSRAIRMLAAAERISAASAIVTLPHWLADAAALKPLAANIATGLHLNLTLGAPLGDCGALSRGGSLPPIARLIALAATRRIEPDDVSAEIERQLDAFEAGLGAPPDFVDGHEHAHVLPVIRPALLRILQRRYSGRPLLIRDPSTPLQQAVRRDAPLTKALSLRFFAHGMRRDVERAGFISNDSFAGISSFSTSARAVAGDFTSAATLNSWRPLVMCHPGFTGDTAAHNDPIAARRQAEFDALMAQKPPIENIWRPCRNSSGMITWLMPPQDCRS